MKIKFIGVGSAFTTSEYFQSNLLITAESGRKMLLDCGTDIRFSLNSSPEACQSVVEEIDAVYISHLHSDHVGGMEWMAFQTYFNPDQRRPRLFMEQDTMQEMWNFSLKGGLGCIEGKRMHLTDYFDCRALPRDGVFEWEGIRFNLVRMPHIITGYRDFFSYGLIMEDVAHGGPMVFFTTDTQFQPGLIQEIAPRAALIFHDCETSPFKSIVHTHYDDLLGLPETIRGKIWLYHYQPCPTQRPEQDGFKGFVSRGRVFSLVEGTIRTEVRE